MSMEQMSLNTDAMTPVAMPSANRRAYDRISDSTPEMLYSSPRPEIVRLMGLRLPRPLNSRISSAPMPARMRPGVLQEAEADHRTADAGDQAHDDEHPGERVEHGALPVALRKRFLHAQAYPKRMCTTPSPKHRISMPMGSVIGSRMIGNRSSVPSSTSKSSPNTVPTSTPPDDGGQPAPQQHARQPAHHARRPAEPDEQRAADGKQQSVAGIAQHQAEQDDVGDGHERRGGPCRADRAANTGPSRPRTG